jgi:pentatricopeptide repeat protein
MPRVRIPNASLIASADFPILPFLAPRVFAESPVKRRSRRDGRHDGVQKEKEKTAAGMEKLSNTQDEHGVQDTCQKRGTSYGEQRRPEGFTAGLLQASASPRLTSVNRLYADIYTLARQHVRSYATTAPTVRRIPGRIFRRVPGSTRPSKQRARTAPSTRTSSAIVRRASLKASVRASQRAKALALERDRLSNYISRLPSGLATKERMRQGQYRSLARRVSNLSSWSATHLDLSKTTGGTKNRHRLNLGFAALDRALYSSLGQHTREINIKHHPWCARLSWKLFPPDTQVDAHQVWTSWVDLDGRTRKAYCHKLLIYLLDRKPDRALRFVQALANDPLLHGHRTEAIADALGHLSKVHAAGLYGIEQDWGADPAAHRRLFAPVFVHVFEAALSKRPDVCSQDLLYNLVQLAETEDLKKVFDCLVKYRTFLGFDTILHYASTFGEAGEVEYALRCLDELRARLKTVSWESVVERPRLRWTCATILRKSMSQGREFHQTPLVVATLVRLGIKMDVLLYNIVMHNAMEAGDYATAFKVYNTLESNGLKADKYTFSILLHGCTLQNNPATFQNFAQYCTEVAKETKDPWLATDYLYYLYVRHQADTEPEHASALLWQAYTSLFSTTPLKPLVDTGDMPTLDSTLLSPPPVALYIMLQAEIRSALAINNHRVLILYQRFKSLAEDSSNPAFRTLTQNPTIWNAFLLAFCSKQQFASASQLIRDMTDGPAKPNIYSWNIFMQAFFKTGQVQPAERVFEIVKSRGVDPDQFTYGVLLRGYAKAQLVERVGETMQHVETKEELDPDLLRSLAGVVNRQRLMLTLEKSRVDKEARTKERAERKAAEERARWTPPQFQLGDVESATPSGDGPIQSDAATIQQAKEPSIVAVSSEESTNEDEGLFSFLSNDEPLEQPSVHTPSPAQILSESQQPKIRTSRPVPPNDPEVQYRKLQEKLGIVAPSQPDRETKPATPFGAGLAFTSVLSKRKKEQPKAVDPSGKSLGFQSVVGKNAEKEGIDAKQDVVKESAPRIGRTVLKK